MVDLWQILVFSKAKFFEVPPEPEKLFLEVIEVEYMIVRVFFPFGTINPKIFWFEKSG